MSVLIQPFTAAGAPRAMLADYHELVLATGRVDRPGEHPVTFEAAVERLTVSLPGRGSALHWAAYRDKRLIGLAEINLPDIGNGQIAMVEIRVHPAHRRRGTGTDLLRAAIPTILDRGRSILTGWGVTEDGAGAAWATASGFRPVHHDVVQALNLRTVDESRWEFRGADRYHLREWHGAAPAEFLESLARTRSAIADQPTEESSFSIPSWTADAVRAHEERLRNNGIEQRVVAAVQSSDGTVAAFTELIILPKRATEALQADTAVLAEHRGRGLGRAVKSAILRQLVRERPAVDRVLTSTAAGNLHMINLNLALGFETIRRMVDVEADAREVYSRLAGPTQED